MRVSEINNSCKTQVFKDIVGDLMYSFRKSFKRFTDTNIDIKLSRIKTVPINTDKFFLIDGRIKNLVGGKVTCALHSVLVRHLQTTTDLVFKQTLTDDEIVQTFVEDLFDNFSSVSKNGILQIGLNEIDHNNNWDNNLYYVQYTIKFKKADGETVNSKAVFGIDELTSVYFKD